MAELVDALVSNTSGFTSMPVRSRLWVPKQNPNWFYQLGFFLFGEFLVKQKLESKKAVSQWNSLLKVAEARLERTTFGLWAQRATTAPLRDILWVQKYNINRNKQVF